jgi:hypothetical protein
MRRKANLLAHPDEPFGGIVLIPSDGITIVHGELVVEVVITFANGHEGSDKMVLGRMFIIERRLPKPMCKRVNTEC